MSHNGFNNYHKGHLRKANSMPLSMPFDPIQRSREVEQIVMKGDKRRYYRFRFAKFYGGIITADALGCNLLCAYCWNYSRNLNPQPDPENTSAPQRSLASSWRSLEIMIAISLGYQVRDVFETRYQKTIDPDKERWEICSRVLARRDIVDRLSVPW